MSTNPPPSTEQALRELVDAAELCANQLDRVGDSRKDTPIILNVREAIEQAEAALAAKEKASIIHKAVVSLTGCLALLDMERPVVEPGHICGPDAGCDGTCVSATYYELMTRPFRDTLRELKKVEQPTLSIAQHHD